MSRGVYTGNVQVTLRGASTAALQETEEELDEFLRDAFDVFSPEEATQFIRAIRRTLKNAHEEMIPEVRAFLTGVVDLDHSPLDDLELVASGVARDFARRNEVLADTYTAPVVAEMLQLTRQAVHDRWKNGRMIGFALNETVLFPTWQFDPQQRDGLLPQLGTVLKVLAENELTPLDRIYWLTSPRPELNRMTPAEALSHGMEEAVIAQARGAGVL